MSKRSFTQIRQSKRKSIPVAVELPDFICSKCDYIAFSHSGLQTHRRDEHPKHICDGFDGVRKHKCGKRFLDTKKYYDHKKLVHKLPHLIRNHKYVTRIEISDSSSDYYSGESSDYGDYSGRSNTESNDRNHMTANLIMNYPSLAVMILMILMILIMNLIILMNPIAIQVISNFL